MTSLPVKKQSALNSLFMFTNIIYVNKKTDYRQIGAAKSKRKKIKFGNTQCSLKQNQKGHSEINE